MTQTEWQSSFAFQSFLKSHGCEITQQANSEYVDVYYKKSEKVISMNANGTLPPYKIELILQTLQIK